jgi:transcriptional regulator with XRE-family HTH domain
VHSIATDIGRRVMAVRLLRCLSQAELERVAGVSPGGVSRIEAGGRGIARTHVNVETLMKLSDALRVDLTWLITGAPSKYPPPMLAGDEPPVQPVPNDSGRQAPEAPKSRPKKR